MQLIQDEARFDNLMMGKRHARHPADGFPLSGYFRQPSALLSCSMCCIYWRGPTLTGGFWTTFRHHKQPRLPFWAARLGAMVCAAQRALYVRRKQACNVAAKIPGCQAPQLSNSVGLCRLKRVTSISLKFPSQPKATSHHITSQTITSPPPMQHGSTTSQD